MRRRQVLATGVAFLSLPLAGCVHPEVVLTMDPATADDITGRVSLHPDPESEEYAVATAAVDNGSTTQRVGTNCSTAPARFGSTTASTS